MKNVASVLALAAGVSATFPGALPFTCPGNTDNHCSDKQKPGFSWGDLGLGSFSQYDDFHFSGWSCQSSSAKKGRFAPRTASKFIGGSCSSEKSQCPSFGCSAGASIDKFSLSSIHVIPEFDCDLEFHYDMPDGSTCKHRNSCSSSGTTVYNTQCGGAKNMTVVFPHQPSKPKPTCSVQVPTISFDCNTHTSTAPPATATVVPPTSTAPPAQVTTTTTPPVDSTSTLPQNTDTAPPAGTTTSTVAPAGTTSGSPPADTNTSGTPAQGTTTAPPQDTTSGTPPQDTASTGPAQDTTSAAPAGTTTSGAPAGTTSAVTQTITTSYDSTSTIFTTSTQTITQCAATVTNCPAHSITTTVVTIAVSTTVCPVTETQTIVSSAAPTSPPAGGSATTSPATGGNSGPGTSVVSSTSPVETLPCPNVVPACLNTFISTVNCKSNTDASCYCPEAAFVENIYNCLYAHGDNDAIVAEAVQYFQGLCAAYVNKNPAVATGATVTTYLSVTAAPTIAPVYTTVTVDVTTVVPCTNSNGETIPSSSSTVTVSTTMTVPQIAITTGPSGAAGVVPVTSVSVAPVATTAPGSGSSGSGSTGGSGSSGSSGSGSDTGSGATPATSVVAPAGTGGVFPTTSGKPVTAGVGRTGASLGVAAAVAFAAALAL